MSLEIVRFCVGYLSEIMYRCLCLDIIIYINAASNRINPCQPLEMKYIAEMDMPREMVKFCDGRLRWDF